MKTFFIVISFMIASSAFASTSAVKCSLSTTAKTPKTVSATLALSQADKEGAEADGLDIGKDNYSFYMALSKLKNGYSVDVTFYENNNVQDEVGGMTCEFSAHDSQIVICAEPITNDKNKIIAQFSCQRI